MKDENKFYDQVIISDDEIEKAKNHNVLELTSNGILVLRYYNENGLDDNNYHTLSLPICNTAYGMMEEIKKEIGKDFLISRSVIDLIYAIVSD